MNTTTPEQSIKTTHTPGQWNVERPFGEPGVYISGPNTGLIAKLYPPDQNLFNGDKLVSIEKNAALIAAAPEMFEMLRQMIYQLEHSTRNLPIRFSLTMERNVEMIATAEALMKRLA
jgi:hypothetical protein